MQNKPRILISGAGIAGLGCTAWLLKNNIRPHVIEKAESVRTGGYLVSISHHAYHYAQELGLISDLLKKESGIRESSYHDERGKSLLELDYQDLFSKVDVIQPMRDGFAEVLYNNVRDNIDIGFGLSIETIKQRNNICEVTFSDGHVDEYDLVIGADGIHSNTRRLAFHENDVKKHHLDLCCAAFRLPNILDIKQKFETHMHRDKYMAVFNTGDEQIGAVFVWESKLRSLPNVKSSYLIEAFKNSSDTIQKVLQYCPSDKKIYMDVLMQIDMKSWKNKRVVLLGDAAHCMTLFSGRGAAAAFNGASQLGIALANSDIDTALNIYEEKMRPVINNIQPQTRNAVKWYVPRTRFHHFLRNTSMRLLPNMFFQNYFRMKYTNI